ncbi:PREDICTED: killer cell lectin-like receptor 3 [Ceratotherium simum simum]|uniref:Killer cell lectin-like receptor 3 n=1 Tax=Ceratotherium simum simum TaxID=73337 RepID=A0ABM1C6X9_CERSS|nr:PREDICTED: killer cell lectin-like receptor 3 [Ceratotherium simum simum]
MSNQEVIFSSVRVLQSPSESQNRSRPGSTQRPGKSDDKEFSVPWHLTVVILGILCLLLFVIIRVLETKIWVFGFTCFKHRIKTTEAMFTVVEPYVSKTQWLFLHSYCSQKINDKDEQAFLQPQTYGNSYWIGLSYNAEERKWKWIEDDTSSGINSPITTLPYGKEECAFLSATRIENTYCFKTYNCICEKRFDCVSTACFK